MKTKIFTTFVLTVFLLSGCTGCEEKAPPPINSEKLESVIFFEDINNSLLYKRGTTALSSICLQSANRQFVSAGALKLLLNIPDLPEEEIPEEVPTPEYSVEFSADRGDYTEIHSRLSMFGLRLTQSINVYHRPSGFHQKFCIQVPDEIIEQYREIEIQKKEAAKKKEEEEKQQEEMKERTMSEDFPIEEIQSLSPDSYRSMQEKLEAYIQESIPFSEEELDAMNDEERQKIEQKVIQKIQEILKNEE